MRVLSASSFNRSSSSNVDISCGCVQSYPVLVRTSRVRSGSCNDRKSFRPSQTPPATTVQAAVPTPSSWCANNWLVTLSVKAVIVIYVIYPMSLIVLSVIWKKFTLSVTVFVIYNHVQCNHVRAAVSADVWNRVICILELLFIRCHFYTLELFKHIPKLTVLSILCVRFSSHCVFIILFILCVPCVRSLW